MGRRLPAPPKPPNAPMSPRRRLWAASIALTERQNPLSSGTHFSPPGTSPAPRPIEQQVVAACLGWDRRSTTPSLELGDPTSRRQG